MALPFTTRRLHFIWRYLRGNAPWDSGIVPPEVVAWVQSATQQGLAPGRALDLGCGTGTTSLYLAAQGWDVLGIDFAPNAVHRARRKARQQALSGRATFISADVSRLDFLPADPPFDLAVDIGCLHGLDFAARARYAAHLLRLLRPGGTYLLYAFLPSLSRDGKRPIGLDLAGLETLFGSALIVVDHTLGQDTTHPIGSGWYTLRRTNAAQ